MVGSAGPQRVVKGITAALAVLILISGPGFSDAQAPTSPDQRLGITDIDVCFSGPGSILDLSCLDCDADGDHDLDLLDVAFHQREFIVAQSLSIPIAADNDDGTEVDATTWYANGADNSDRNRMGQIGGKSYNVALRYHLPDVLRGETFAYARIALPASDQGSVASAVYLHIVGIDADNALSFDVARPSQQPKTTAAVNWSLTENWPVGAGDDSCMPLFRQTPDLAAIINEIVGRPDWGTGPDGKTLALVIENECREMNALEIQDYVESEYVVCPGHVFSPTLELYRTTRSTFIGTEILGRPTDHSITINAVSLAPSRGVCRIRPGPPARWRIKLRPPSCPPTHRLKSPPR